MYGMPATVQTPVKYTAKGRLQRKYYERELRRLQEELAVLQRWIVTKGLKVLVICEGRDAAGKGGVIKRIVERLNPRVCRVVALGVPTEREQSQWYFQRYVAHLPAAGEMVLFDRSWYNRAGVERVMGFCTEQEYHEFLVSCPQFERMLIRSGIQIIKYWFLGERRGAGEAFPGQAHRSQTTVEAERDGFGVPEPLGRLLEGQGRDVRSHRHNRRPLECG